MTIGTRIDSNVGRNEVNNLDGTVIAKDSVNHRGFMPYVADSITPLTSVGGLLATQAVTMSAGQAGVLTISSSTATVMYVVLPKASESAGAMFMFRNICDVANVITTSRETPGTASIVSVLSSTIVTGGPKGGAKLTFGAVGGASVTLACDGASFFVLAASGSVTIA